MAAPLSAEDQKKVLYALGMSLGKNVGQFSLTNEEVAEMQKGLADQVLGKTTAVKIEEYGPKIQNLYKARQADRAKAEAAKGEEFLAKMANEAGAQKTPSGLIYFETQAGSGPSPAATDTVKVHYRGTLIDGKEFDSSFKRNEPIEFPLSGVIPCWTEGVQKMKVGGKAKLICPSKIAYGERGAGADIPPNATLQFEVELISIKEPPKPEPAAPATAAAPTPAPAPQPAKSGCAAVPGAPILFAVALLGLLRRRRKLLGGLFAACLLVIFAAPATAQPPPGGMPPPSAPPAEPLSPAETKKVVYALGMSLGKNLAPFALKPDEVKMVQKGLADQIAGKTDPAIKLEDWGPKIQELYKARQAERGKAELAKGEEYLTKMTREKGAVKTPSGLIYIETKAGTGPNPAATDTVKVHYRGTLIDGKEFDSSFKRNEPIEFPLSGVIPCWTEGVQKMKPGGKAKLICPSKIAYGERGAGADIPPNATLTFEVELIAIKPPAPPQPTPVPGGGHPPHPGHHPGEGGPQ